MTLAPPYTYSAVVVRVIDGDTVVCDVDLGFGIWLRDQSYRLDGCNAIERYEPGGREATANLRLLLPVGSHVLLSSVRNDKYGGRYDARIRTAQIGDLTEYLIDQGWAVPYAGVGPLPVPVWPRPEPDPEPFEWGRRSDYGLAKGERERNP